MPTYSKQLLSASTNGKQILVSATGSGSAVTLHTAVAGTTNLDEIYLYAYNDYVSGVQLNVSWGGTGEPSDIMRVTIPSKIGRTLIVDGKLLQNSLAVKAYASIANVVIIDGFVNNIQT